MAVPHKWWSNHLILKSKTKTKKKKIHIEMHHRFKRAKTIKRLEENIKETYSLLRSRWRFLKRTQNTYFTRGKNKLKLIKIKKFSLKNTAKAMKSKGTDLRKVFKFIYLTKDVCPEHTKKSLLQLSI